MKLSNIRKHTVVVSGIAVFVLAAFGPRGRTFEGSSKGDPAGVPGYEIKTNTITVQPGSHMGSTSFCSSRKRVLAGGFDIQGSPPAAPNYATRSAPSSNNDGWNVNVQNNGSSPVQVVIYAICYK